MPKTAHKYVISCFDKLSQTISQVLSDYACTFA